MVAVFLAKPAESFTLLTLATNIITKTGLDVSDYQGLVNTTHLLFPVISEVTAIFHTRLKQI